MTSVRCESISKKAGGRLILRNASLEAGAGERIALVGPSGAGKTTLLHVVAGLERPDAGRVLFDDALMSSSTVQIPPERRFVGLVFQDRALWPHLTAAEHFRIISRGRSDGRDVLRRMRMEHVLLRRPEQMSGGEAQRLAVALAIAGEPRILLLDEPRGQIDPDSLASMDELIDEFLGRRRATCILITHDCNDSASWAERVAIMHEGTIVQQASFEELYRRPVSAVVARQTGESALVSGLMIGPNLARTSLGPVQVCSHEAIDGAVKLVIRPEQLVCDPNGPISMRTLGSRFVHGRWLVVLVIQEERLFAYFPQKVEAEVFLTVRILEPVWAVPAGLRNGRGS